jgi:two-component sensor histidine kinase
MVEFEQSLTIESVEHAGALARAIVDTIREPLLVLDRDLRVVAASRSFYRTFQVEPAATQGRLLTELGTGQWDIPELCSLLEKIVSEHTVMEAYEVEREFPGIGRRTMLLNARKVFYEGNSHSTILVAFEDITERRAIERRLQELLAQRDTLLAEMSHRISNSLQIIASILLMKARVVQSPEIRLHLEDAHRRIVSIASVQRHLQATNHGAMISVSSYLTKLCDSLADSMIGDTRPVSLTVVADDGAVGSAQAICIGLIVTELVINALKYAFADDRIGARVIVGYESEGANWKLSVSDNGRGIADDSEAGLGRSLVKALAEQLDGTVDIKTGAAGTTVSITHATFTSRLPTAA